jgi:hypothetical protein
LSGDFRGGLLWISGTDPAAISCMTGLTQIIAQKNDARVRHMTTPVAFCKSDLVADQGAKAGCMRSFTSKHGNFLRKEVVRAGGDPRDLLPSLGVIRHAVLLCGGERLGKSGDCLSVGAKKNPD